MVHVPSSTTVNTTEFKPEADAIAFAPELIQFISDNQKIMTYRFGRKYDHLQVGNVVKYQNSATGEIVGMLKITSKRETTFGDLTTDNPGHEAYKDKEHQRKVLSGYYAYLGRELRDDDLFLVFDFVLADPKK